jgi:acyl carrier protein
MDRDEIETRVRDVVVRVANLSEDQHALSPDADLFRDLGVASTAALDLLLSLEEEFDVAIPDQRFGDARTLRALTALLGELT